MTREEAIKWLKRIKERYILCGDEGFDKARKEALHMAIRSLEAWESLYEKTAEWESEALYEVEKHCHDEDAGEWRKWSHILNERTAFLCDVKKHLKEVENDKG